jgi:hypothetical protein
VFFNFLCLSTQVTSKSNTRFRCGKNWLNSLYYSKLLTHSVAFEGRAENGPACLGLSWQSMPWVTRPWVVLLCSFVFKLRKGERERKITNYLQVAKKVFCWEGQKKIMHFLLLENNFLFHFEILFVNNKEIYYCLFKHNWLPM